MVSMAKRLQSAMEYLMTYGWAILIIAIVLVALFQLGIFNSMNLTPKASPGSCQIYRPSGLESTQQPQLAGSCNNLLPQYVALFNGQSSSILVSNSVSLNPTSALTYSFWVYPTQPTTVQCIIDKNWGNVGGVQIYISTNGDINFNAGTNHAGGVSPPITKNQWYFVTVSASSAGMTLHINSTNVTYELSAPTLASNSLPLSIATCDYGTVDYFNGELANLQIYNTSLSSNDITVLYGEGIGGAPIDLYNLVAWYPLNGNANDYSGNNHNGVANNVVYSANWWGSYSQP